MAKTDERLKQGIGITEYNKIHTFLLKYHGKATKCTALDCTSINPKRFEHAIIKGRKYSYDINDYIDLCPSCHRKYDMTEELRNKMSVINKANPRDPMGLNLPQQHGKMRGQHQTAKKIKSIDKQGNVERFDSMISAFDKYGYLSANISKCISGRRITAYKKTWYYDK